MAAVLSIHPGPGFMGHHSIFQFVNADSANQAKACGQAAIATVLANYHRLPKGIAGLQRIEKEYPPDVASGEWGTTADRIRRALTSYKVGHHNVSGRDGLEHAMRHRRAAIALVQNVGGIKNGGHWFVVFGCDQNGIYATNYTTPFIAWSQFADMWSGAIPVVGGMAERVISC